MDAWRAAVRDVGWTASLLRWFVSLHNRGTKSRLISCPSRSPEITDKMYKKILHNPLIFGDEISPLARSILTGLLNRDPSQRLGVNGADEIKRHPFFAQHIDFERLLQKKIQPPFKPSVSSPVDVSNFDTVFTAEEPTDSVVEGSKLSQTVQAQFAGSWFPLFGFAFVVVLMLVDIRVLLRWHEHASEPVNGKT